MKRRIPSRASINSIGNIRSARSRAAMQIIATAVAFAGSHEALGDPQNLFWDPNGTTAGAATAASFAAGTWNATNTNWNSDSTGVAAPIAWTPGGTANFSAGANATGAFTVTVAGTQIFSGLNVQVGSITLAPATGGGILSYAPTDPLNIWTVNTPLVINVPIAEDPSATASTSDTAIVFSGNGAVTLGASNSFTNTIVVGAGGLTITNGNALGDNIGSTLLQSTATAAKTLTFSNAINSAEPITIAAGTLAGSAASNTASGTITLNNGVIADAINVASGGTFTFSGLIQDGGAPQTYKYGAGTMILTGSLSYGGTLTVGNGTLLVQGTGSIAGNVSQINVAGSAAAAGNLSVKGTGKIAATNNNGIAIGMGANITTYSAGTNTPLLPTFTLDKSSTLADNIDDNSTITLAGGGVFNLVGNAAASSETIGTLNILGGVDAKLLGENLINATGAAGLMTVTATGFNRGPGSVVTFRGTNLGGASGANAVQFKFTNTPTLLGAAGAAGTPTVSIMPGVLSDNTITSNAFVGYLNNAAGQGSGFATYDATVGVRALTPSEYSSSFATNNNVSVSSAASVNSNVTINSLRLNGAGANVAVGGSNTLGITSGMILANTAATGNIGISGGTLDFQGHEPIVINRNAMTISSNLTNGNGFTKQGLGTLTLTGSGAGLHGNTYLEEGATVISSADALGDGRTTVAPGAALELNSATGMTITHNVAVGGYFNALNGAQFGVPAATDTINGFASNGGNIGGIESLSGNNEISTLELTGGPLVGDPGGNPGNNIGNPGLNGVGVAAGSTLTIDNITNPSGPGSLVKIGDGTLVLNHANSIPGVLRIWGGVINLQANQAMGSSNLGVPFVAWLANTRSTIGFSNNVKYTTLDHDFTQMSGFGAGSLGIVDNFGGANRYDNGLTTQIARIGAFDTLVPTYIGSQSGTLTLNGTFNAGNNATPRLMIKLGGGTIVMGNNINYSGPTEIQAGALVLGSNGSGDATGFGKFNQTANDATQPNWLSVFSGASLVVDDTGSAEALTDNKRFNGTGTRVLLMGSEFKLIGNNAANDGFNLPSTGAGSFTLIGNPTLTVSQPPGGSQTILQLNHARAANDYTLLVRGNNLGTPGGGLDNEITNTATPSFVGNTTGSGAATPIIPWAFGDTSETGGGSDLVTFGTHGFVPLSSSQYAASGNLPQSDTINNFKITGDQNGLVADSGVNGLVVNNANIDLGNTTLTVKSGAVVMASGTGPTTISNGTLAFGSAEGIIHTASGHDTVISSVITGSGGLTKSGSAKLTVSANNTFTGPVSLNGGALVASTDTNLGAAANTVNMAGGVLQPAPAYTSTSRNFTLSSKSGGFNVQGSQSFTIAGTISGSSTYAPLVKFGTGTLVLSPPVSNTWIGGAVIKEGTLRIASDAALGSNSTAAGNNGANGSTAINPGSAIPLQIDGGTLSFSDNAGLGQRAIYLGKNNGTISVDAGKTVTFDTPVGTGDANLIAFFGPGMFIKEGAGTFEFFGNTPSYNGGTDIRGGTLKLDRNDAFPGSALNRVVRVDGGTLLLNLTATATTTETNGFVQLGNNGTFASLGTGSYNATAIPGFPTVENAASVTLSSVNAGAVFAIGSQMSNLDPTNIVAPTVNIRGAGTVYLVNQPLPNFIANYNIDGSTLRINDQNAALGVQTNPVSFSSNGGTLDMRLSGAGKTYNNPVALNGDGTFVESTTNTNATNTFTGATNTFGNLTVLSAATLTSTNINGGVAGVTTGNVGLVFPSASLSGDLTVNVVNPTATGSIGTVAIGTAGGAGVSEAVAGKSLTKTGPGVLTLRGSSTYTGSTTVNAGTLILSQAAAWGPALNGPGATTIASGGKLVFDYTGNAGSNPVTALRTKLQTSYGSNFATGQFRTAGDATHGLGYFDNGTSNVLVRYTYYGDANLDGSVNTLDFNALAATFNSASGTWQTGDFNYDGIVNMLDFNAVATNFGATAIPGEPLGATGLGSLVPEPGSLALAGLGVAALASRRRRK